MIIWTMICVWNQHFIKIWRSNSSKKTINKLNKKQHEYKLNYNKTFECEICESKFYRRGGLNQHISSVHESNYSFKCAICNSTFKQKGALKFFFESVHEGKRPFECKFCDTTFVTGSLFKIQHWNVMLCTSIDCNHLFMRVKNYSIATF